jgi:hypothetical protein
VAVAQSVLVIICPVLRERQPYHDLGADYFDRLETARIERHYVRRLEQLGYTVTKLIPARLLPWRALRRRRSLDGAAGATLAAPAFARA